LEWSSNTTSNEEEEEVNVYPMTDTTFKESELEKEEMSLTEEKARRSSYLDSVCSQHMTRERCMFHCLTLMHGGTVTFRGNKKGLITWVGKISIHPYPPIDNVLFAEGLKHNFSSIIQLHDIRYDVSFNKDKCIFQNWDGSLLFSAKRKGNLYKIRLGEL